MITKINPAIFREYDIRGRYPEEIDELSAYFLGRAFVRSQKAKQVAVSRDRRRESEKIYPPFVKGLRSAGAKVWDLGINSTPALFFAVGQKRLDGGVSITASHNPPGYTGLKMCDRHGTLLGNNTGNKKLIIALAKDRPVPQPRLAPLAALDIAADYWRFVGQIVAPDKIKGFKLILDASNGSGARLADYFFVRLRSRITKMNFRRGDQFPDHGLNPLLASNYRLAQVEVKKRQADLGIIWDGDGDRCIFIDHQGRYLPPYYLNCLLAEIILQKHPGAAIVIDARLPLGLSEVIAAAGGRAIVSRAGYTNVVQTMQREKNIFGCENSGHYFFNFRLADKKNRDYVFGDALIPPLLILEYLREHRVSLATAVSRFRRAYQLSGEINFSAVNFDRIKNKVEKKYRQGKIDMIDGVSVYGDGWFFNLRPSQTEPLVRLNIEARSQTALGRIKKEVTGLITSLRNQ